MKTINKLFVFLCLLISTYAARVVLEAENGKLNGVQKLSDLSGYSGSGYVGRFETTGNSVTVTTTVSSTGMYDLAIIYCANMGTKTNTLVINGVGAGDIVFDENTSFEEKSLGSVFLKAGENTIGFQSSWGWMFVDAFVLNNTPNSAKDVSSNLDASLVNPKAIPAARKLYDYLKSIYGKNILSGQTGKAGACGDEPEEFQRIRSASGKTPAVWNTDFIFESQDPTWRPTNPSLLDGALAWWKKYQGKGIMAAQWHWNIAGRTGNYGFYSKDTTFDIEQAVIEGTWEYKKIIVDIDHVSSIIKEFQKVNMPILWRPLHENNGDWFWWGAKPEACAKLWKILYERMVNVHGLNNLIWLWNGNMDKYTPIDYIDLIGVDIYANDHGPQTTAYNTHFDYFKGRKMVVLSENGRIPEIQDCVDQGAWWGYFQTWNSEFMMSESYHTTAQIKKYFTHPNVINQDGLPSFDVTSYEGSSSGGSSGGSSSTTCFSVALGFPCCKGTTVVYTDNDGKWGVENNEWCGIGGSSSSSTETCWSKALGYSCCPSNTAVIYTDNDGKWGVNNNEWCGII